jgi:hypothetical protein
MHIEIVTKQSRLLKKFSTFQISKVLLKPLLKFATIAKEPNSKDISIVNFLTL